MDPERWTRVREAFEAALDLSPDERRAFVAGIEADDGEVHAAVVQMLDAHACSADHLEPPSLNLDPTSTLDCREYQALAGVAWGATAKTTGEGLVGIRRLDFNTPGRPSVHGFTWDARLTWAPRTYSQLTAYSSRSVSQDGFSAGNVGSSTSHAPSSRLRRTLSSGPSTVIRAISAGLSPGRTTDFCTPLFRRPES